MHLSVKQLGYQCETPVSLYVRMLYISRHPATFKFIHNWVKIISWVLPLDRDERFSVFLLVTWSKKNLRLYWCQVFWFDSVFVCFLAKWYKNGDPRHAKASQNVQYKITRSVSANNLTLVRPTWTSKMSSGQVVSSKVACSNLQMVDKLFLFTPHFSVSSFLKTDVGRVFIIGWSKWRLKGKSYFSTPLFHC